MRRRPKWSHVVISLGVIAAIAIAAPASGISSSIKKAIRKEVAKQISKATGPRGPAGANGTNGADGAAGTARAYARVFSHVSTACTLGTGDQCTFNRAKGITAVHRTGVGQYCVIAPGIDSNQVAAVTSVDWTSTNGPEGNGSALYNGTCMTTGFSVRTERHSDLNGTNAVEADDVGFTIIIP
jgi:hypothetical protein